VKLTFALPEEPAVAVTPVGAPGTVAGLTTVIVAMPEPLMVPPVGELSLKVNVSGLLVSQLRIGTRTVSVVTPGGKVSVPLSPKYTSVGYTHDAYCPAPVPSAVVY
jgi:hypothetical protein